MPSLWIVRVARGHVRLWLAIAAGVVTYLVLPSPGWRVVTRMLTAWDFAVLLYLATTAVMMGSSSVAMIRKHSCDQDEGAFALLVLTVAAAMASLGAIFAELGAGAGEPGVWAYVLAIATVILSWAFIHTIFALHYAHDFYGEGNRANGLKFPGDGQPDYWDFVYFSFVIGMTFQVSDVQVTNKLIRRSVVAHGVLSFFYTTTVVALAVNMAASAI